MLCWDWASKSTRSWEVMESPKVSEVRNGLASGGVGPPATAAKACVRMLLSHVDSEGAGADCGLVGTVWVNCSEQKKTIPCINTM